jgi:hypothetical protein
MSKELDTTITTIGHFRHATKSLNGEMQIYMQNTGNGVDDSALVEITEIQLTLPKNENDEAYLILRCK